MLTVTPAAEAVDAILANSEGCGSCGGMMAPLSVEDSRLVPAVSAGFLRVWPRAGL